MSSLRLRRPRLRAVLWIPRNQHRVVEQEYCRIAVVLGLNFEHGVRREILKKHSCGSSKLNSVWFARHLCLLNTTASQPSSRWTAEVTDVFDLQVHGVLRTHRW